VSGASVTVKPNPTEVRLRASKERVAYGGSVTLVARVLGGDADRMILFTGTNIDGRTRTLATVAADDRGVASIVTTPRGRTTYEASYAGNDRWRSSSARVRVEVSAIVDAQMVRADGRDGAYRLYRRSHRVWIRTNMRPALPGTTGEIWMYQMIRREWVRVLRGEFIWGDRGVALLYFRPRVFPVGARFRIQISGGARDLIPGFSPHAYFRIIA
jgi:hypothetical protein